MEENSALCFSQSVRLNIPNVWFGFVNLNIHQSNLPVYALLCKQPLSIYCNKLKYSILGTDGRKIAIQKIILAFKSF